MPTVGYMPDEEETEIYANTLLVELTRHQLIQEQGVQEQVLDTDPNLDFLGHFDTIPMKQIGHDLRLLSEEFARSKQRNQVLQKARAVDIDAVDFHQFTEFLEEFFSGGITRERIVVLFFFCSDVVARAYTHPVGTMHNLFRWCIMFIKNKVCKWVQELGGWGVFFQDYMPAFSKTLFYTAATVVVCVFFWKKVLFA